MTARDFRRGRFLIIDLLFFFTFRILFFAALYKVLGKENYMYDDEREVHKCRGICGQQQAVYDERNTAHHIYYAGLYLVAR